MGEGRVDPNESQQIESSESTFIVLRENAWTNCRISTPLFTNSAWDHGIFIRASTFKWPNASCHSVRGRLDPSPFSRRARAKSPPFSLLPEHSNITWLSALVTVHFPPAFVTLYPCFSKLISESSWYFMLGAYLTSFSLMFIVGMLVLVGRFTSPIPSIGLIVPSAASTVSLTGLKFVKVSLFVWSDEIFHKMRKLFWIKFRVFYRGKKI